MRVLLSILGALFIAGASTFGQSAELDSEIRITRYLSTAYALPGSQFLVTLRLETKHDLAGVGVNEFLPTGWSIHPLENAGAAFKRATGHWVFGEIIRAGSTRELVYEVSIPSADQLIGKPLPACFSITGTLQARVPALEVLTTGDSALQIVSALPILSAIAHLVPQKNKAPDSIDLRLPQTLTQDQLTRALELWQWATPVPQTNGEWIDLATMNKLSAYYQTCTPLDRPLPIGLDPGFVAVRTISTFLPYDSVLPPEGCFDPGLDARRFTVTVDITSGHDAYGVGLKEWVQAGWRVTPIKHEGFWYRSSQTEWVYPKRLSAGETVQIVYQVEILPSNGGALEEHNGCCGRNITLVGTVSSGLECSERDVTGETSIHVWDCLAVILAISRWDTESDGLDVTLSDLITFPQVQRAVAFWLEGAALPHTCGYTVGYETLKTIVAYWLTDTPVTEGLPETPVGACEDIGSECYVPSGTYDWFCRMKKHQPPTDRVGVPPSQPPIVDAGPDLELTCSIQTATLTATVTGGVPPYVYEWLESSGKPIGSTPSVVVRNPGTYTLIVTGCGGCQGADTVAVTEDIEPPSVAARVSRPVTCSDTHVTLTAVVKSGRFPYAYQWIDPIGEVCGIASSIVADAPGRYTVVVTGANGCTASDTVTVAEDVESPVVDVGPDRYVDCRVRQVTLQARLTGGKPPFSCKWIDSAGAVVETSNEFTVDVPDVYTLTVTGANGCTASDSVTVIQDIEPPTVDAGPDQRITCANPEVALNTTVRGGRKPYAFVWQDERSTTIACTGSIVVSEPGRYVVTVVGANGCCASDEVTVTQDVAPPVVDAGPDREITCANPEVFIDVSVCGGSPPYTYLWIDDCGEMIAVTEDITVTLPGLYTIIVTGANSCSSITLINVVNKIEPPHVDAGQDKVLTCEIEEVLLEATVSNGAEPYQYVWTNACGVVVGRTEDLIVSLPSLYTLTVTTADGCIASDSVEVTQELESRTIHL